jgi:hypothetical protein
MGKVVRMAQVYRAILKTYGTTISALEARGRTSVTFTFEAFEDAIYEAELCYDRRTIMSKWKMAVAQGVLDEITPGISANMDLPYLRFLARDTNLSAHTHHPAQNLHRIDTESTQEASE